MDTNNYKRNENLLTEQDVIIIEPLEMHSLQAVTDMDIIVMKLVI